MSNVRAKWTEHRVAPLMGNNQRCERCGEVIVRIDPCLGSTCFRPGVVYRSANLAVAELPSGEHAVPCEPWFG